MIQSKLAIDAIAALLAAAVLIIVPGLAIVAIFAVFVWAVAKGAKAEHGKLAGTWTIDPAIAPLVLLTMRELGITAAKINGPGWAARPTT